MSKFREVIDFYQEAKANASSYGSIDYEESGNGGQVGTQCVVGRVVMSFSDYVADVEITARRVLGPKQYYFFKAVYMSGEVTTTQRMSDAYKALDAQVHEILGQAFIDNKLSPPESYMRSVKVA